MLGVDRVLTLRVMKPWLQKREQAQKVVISILMYHSIADESENRRSDYYRTVTTPTRFRRHMEWLKREGYSVIDLADAVKLLKGGSVPGVSSSAATIEPLMGVRPRSSSIPSFHHSNIPSSKPVVLTFDDGFRDFLVNAWPVLMDLGFRSTVYLPTEFIGQPRMAFKDKACLTWGEVRDLVKSGVTFGSHTASHPVLYDLSWEEIRRELLQSRLRMEDQLQMPISRFSYPYAFPQEDYGFVRRFKEELNEQGYSSGVTTIIGRAQSSCDVLCLPRVPINERDDQDLFEAKIKGAYDWMGGAQACFRKMRYTMRKVGMAKKKESMVRQKIS